MFFDGALCALGNILFLAGLPLVIGTRKTLAFFARKNKLRGSQSHSVVMLLQRL